MDTKRLYKINNPFAQLRAVESALDAAIREADDEVIEVIRKATNAIVSKLEKYPLKGGIQPPPGGT